MELPWYIWWLAGVLVLGIFALLIERGIEACKPLNDFLSRE